MKMAKILVVFLLLCAPLFSFSEELGDYDAYVQGVDFDCGDRDNSYQVAKDGEYLLVNYRTKLEKHPHYKKVEKRVTPTSSDYNYTFISEDGKVVSFRVSYSLNVQDRNRITFLYQTNSTFIRGICFDARGK